MGLLAYVMIKFRASANPEPTKTTHNTTIEVIWTPRSGCYFGVSCHTVLPTADIAVQSSKRTNGDDQGPPDISGIGVLNIRTMWKFPSRPAQSVSQKLPAVKRPPMPSVSIQGKEDLAEYPRLLAVDNELVVPVGEVVRVLVTAGDVIHNFAPSGIRSENGWLSRTYQRNLLPGIQRGTLLRPVFRAVRQVPRLYATWPFV